MKQSWLVRYGDWQEKHKDAIIIGGLITVGVVLTVCIIKADLDARNVAIDQLNTNINELNAWHASQQLAA